MALSALTSARRAAVARVAPLAAAPLLLALCALLPGAWLAGADRLLGRPGGALLVLALLLLAAQALQAARRQAPASSVVVPEPVSAEIPVAAILASQIELDQAIGTRLDTIVADTETAALAIVGNVRSLYDSASKVVHYLESSGMQADELGREISDSVRYLSDIGSFIGAMPPKLERDLHNVGCVIDEIGAMSALIEGVHAISIESHMLSINAAIEAGRAGPAGAAFAVLATQMRRLAGDSREVATRIQRGLAQTRAVIEGGMAAGLAESSTQLGQVAQAVASIDKLKDNFEDMSQYYKIRFAVVSKHNADLAGDISAALGQIQHQDVLRQTIGRIQSALGQRHAALNDHGSGATPATLPQRLDLVTADYLREEGRHGLAADADASLPAFELF